MSDEFFQLRNENIELKKIVGKLEAKNAELTEENDKSEGKNAELIEKNGKLEKEIELLKAENLKLKNLTETELTFAIQTSQPIEGEKPKPKRFFKNWLLFDTLPWIDRKELSNSSLSTASETFRQLCWPKLHGNVKPHKIRHLRISPAHYELGKFRAQVHLRTGVGWGREEIIPIASIPPLDYILGIKKIEISFVNDEVMNFLKSIENLLQNCKLQMVVLNKKHNSSSMRSLMDFLANKIYLLKLGLQPNQLRLNYFSNFFPGFIDNVQFLQLCAFPNNDEIEIILNWLKKQEANNGKQKIIKIVGMFGPKFMATLSVASMRNFQIQSHHPFFLLILEKMNMRNLRLKMCEPTKF